MAKAKATAQGDNPRFEVTPLPSQGLAPEKDRERFSPARLYEEFYGGRGPMENVLRHQMVDRKAGRLSPHHLRSNQRRWWLGARADLLIERARAVGWAGAELAQATVGSMRRVNVQWSSAYPLRELFLHKCARRLAALALWSGFSAAYHNLELVWSQKNWPPERCRKNPRKTMLFPSERLSRLMRD